jgi:hypothetical protein
MINWESERVQDQSSGVTDLITNAPNTFQEECNNLVHNYKIDLLSSRDGYKHHTAVTTIAKIQQLLKLEGYIFALCYDDQVALNTQIDGRIFYRLESDTGGVWSEVQTPKARTSTTFNVSSKNGKGFNFNHTSIASDMFTVLSWGTGNPSPTVGLGLYNNTFLHLNNGFLNADGTYTYLGNPLNYTNLQSIFSSTGFTLTFFSGTVGSDIVYFVNQLAPKDYPTGVYVYPNVRSNGTGARLPCFNEQGHVQWPEWSSHLYLANEPYDKKYVINASDQFGADPDTYPPDNQRLPLRKMALVSTQPGVAVPGYAPLMANAQLPKMFIGEDTTHTTDGLWTTAVSSYQYMGISCSYKWSGTKYVPYNQYIDITIWSERSWGRIDASQSGASQYFRIVAVTGLTPDGRDNAYVLIDYSLRNDPKYTSFNILWGQLLLCWHTNTGKTEDTYTNAVAAINDAFTRYQTTTTASYEPFGFYVQPNPTANGGDKILLTTFATTAINFWAGLPENVPGNHQYGYAAYMRDSYYASVETEPRQFGFDGPTVFIQARTLGQVGAADINNYFTDTKGQFVRFSRSPKIWGGIAVRYLRDTDLYFQSNNVVLFARTEDKGDVYYIDTNTLYWIPTASAISQGVLPQSLINAGWNNTTCYVIPQNSTIKDRDLVFAESSYFNGGVLSYDSVPQGPYYFDMTTEVGHYVNIVQNIQRVYQSTPGIPHASPASLFSDFNEDLTGIKTYIDRPIVFTATETWRLEGLKDALGSGRIIQRKVSDRYGCIANHSIVRTNIGLFYWSQSGIIFTDGLSATRVSEHIITRYNKWLYNVRTAPLEIGPKQLRGEFDELNQTVVWSLWDENKKPFFVKLSLRQGVSPQMPIWTENGVRRTSYNSGTGVFTNTDYFHTHAMLYSDAQQRFYRSQGNDLLYAAEGQTYDECDVVGLTIPIRPFLKSVAFSFNSQWTRKIVKKAMLNFRDLQSKGVSVQPVCWDDLATQFRYLDSCLNFQHLPWAQTYATTTPLDLEQFFQHSDCQWKSEHIVSYKRSFPSGRIRNVYKAFGIMQLDYLYGEINSKTTGVTNITVTIKRNTNPQVAIVTMRTDPAFNPVTTLALDVSGKFLLTYADDQVPMQIMDISQSGNDHILHVLTGESVLTNVADFVYNWPDLKFYRQFTDQRIDLIGYNLTYRHIGDQTQGNHKGTASGGTSQ